MKVIKVKDTGKFLIQFNSRDDSGGKYEIKYKNDEKIVNFYSGKLEVEVDGVEQIRKISSNSISTHYEDAEGNKLPLEAYEEQRKVLIKNAKGDHYGNLRFEDLDEEYAYKKFERTWTRIFREVVTYGDPLPFEKITSSFETGNKYISSGLSRMENDPTIFYVDMLSASIHLTQKCFTELGMVFKGDVNYGETKKDKIWGNSAHSGIRYVTAFGTYVFDDSFNYKNRGIRRGTLKQCFDMYENLEKKIREKIITQYNLHFSNISVDFAKNLATESLEALKEARGKISRLDPKVKDYSLHTSIQRKLQEHIESLEESLSKKI